MEELKEKILEYKESIYRYAFKILQNSSDAMDCTQDVLLKLWQNRKKFGAHPNPAGYVFLATKNTCLNMLRESKKFDGEELSEWDAWTEMDPITKESARILTELINNLSEPQKSVIKMRDIEGYDYDEIAKKLDLSVNNVRVILSRTRKQMKESLIKIHAYERERVL